MSFDGATMLPSSVWSFGPNHPSASSSLLTQQGRVAMNANTTGGIALLYSSKFRSISALTLRWGLLSLVIAVCWGMASAQRPGCRLNDYSSVQVVAGVAEQCQMQWTPEAMASMAAPHVVVNRQRATQFTLKHAGYIALDDAATCTSPIRRLPAFSR